MAVHRETRILVLHKLIRVYGQAEGFVDFIANGEDHAIHIYGSFIACAHCFRICASQ